MHERIQLAHGDGGELSHRLVKELFHKHFTDKRLTQLYDAAVLPSEVGRIAVTTDSFVVNPAFFPGGNIGKLAVAGTVNDLAVTGAVPRYLTAAFILEEGLLLSDLELIVTTMAETAKEAGIAVIAGDTKVVERGSADTIFINTTGIGWIPANRDLGYHQIREGDLVIINGNIGDHGIAILSQREGLSFDTPVKSDCAPLNTLTEYILNNYGPAVRIMRDPTRGGVATTLKEITLSSGYDVYLTEKKLPYDDAVTGLAEILGLDPLYLANEGKMLAIVDPAAAPAIIESLKSMPGGGRAAIIGEVREGKGDVYLRTAFGGTRIVEMLAGEPLPRIC